MKVFRIMRCASREPSELHAIVLDRFENYARLHVMVFRITRGNSQGSLQLRVVTREALFRTTRGNSPRTLVTRAMRSRCVFICATHAMRFLCVPETPFCAAAVSHIVGLKLRTKVLFVFETAFFMQSSWRTKEILKN